MATSVTVVPSTGHALTFTQGGIGSTPGYDAIDLRRPESLRTEGILHSTAWAVTQDSGGASMNVDVAANIGPALVQGDAVTNQGLYYVNPHSAKITVTATTADASNPRVDRIVLEIKDNAHDGSGFNLAQVRIVAGTATVGATLTNLTGAPALPNSALHLAYCLVGAAATTIPTANIQDGRVHSYPGLSTILTGSNNYPASTSTTGYFVNGGINVVPTPSVGSALAFVDLEIGTPLRLKVQQTTGNTAPAQTLTVGLYPVTAVAGGSYTIGSVVSGSTVAFTTTAANTIVRSISGAVTIATAGLYAVGVASSGSTAASSGHNISFQLQIRLP